MAVGVGESPESAKRMLPCLLTNWSKRLGVSDGPNPIKHQMDVSLPNGLLG